jgi:hypothetical protein
MGEMCLEFDSIVIDTVSRSDESLHRAVFL